jgi:hypothetical protein
MMRLRPLFYLLFILYGCNPTTTTTYTLKNESAYAFRVRVKSSAGDQTIAFQPDETNTIAIFNDRTTATVLKFDSLVILPPPNLKALKDLKAESSWTKEDGKKKNGKYQSYYNAMITNSDFK